MRLLVLIVGWIFSSLLFVDCSEKIYKRDQQCFIEGRCIKSQNVDVQMSKNEIECLEICKSNEKCNWFSFKIENNFCELLNNCTQLEETNLFISGSTECEIPRCWINGECLGTVIHSESTKSKLECLHLCKSDAECNWFTFYEVFSECVLYGDCPTVDETCSRCFSGEHSCVEEEKPQGFTKLLVGSGNNGGGLDSVEVVDLSSSSSSCKQLPKYPVKTSFSFGGLFNNTTPIICGGYDGDKVSDECHTLNQNSWMQAQSMSVPRFGASLTSYPSAVATSENDLLVIGGVNSSPGYLSSLEVYSHSGWNLINSQLPEGLGFACAITVNGTHILITGGVTASLSGGTSGTMWFDSVNEKFSSGPTLNSVRSYHGCGKLKSIETNEVYIIVAGGYDGSDYLDSTEILELGSNEWKLGPKLPLKISETTMVEDKVSNSVLLVGGYDGKKSNKIFKLASPLIISSQWEELPQKLSVGRQAQPVAFFIPDSFVDCHEKSNQKKPKDF